MNVFKFSIGSPAFDSDQLTVHFCFHPQAKLKWKRKMQSNLLNIKTKQINSNQNSALMKNSCAFKIKLKLLNSFALLLITAAWIDSVYFSNCFRRRILFSQNSLTGFEISLKPLFVNIFNLCLMSMTANTFRTLTSIRNNEQFDIILLWLLNLSTIKMMWVA